MELKLPAFRVPEIIGRLNSKLPQLPPTLGLIAALNLALDRLLPRERLAALAGKRLEIHVLDAGLRMRFMLGSRGFVPTFERAAPDLRIAANARDFIALALREEDADTLFFDRRLVMEGDTELGLTVKNTLDAVELPRLSAADLSPRALLARLRPGNSQTA